MQQYEKDKKIKTGIQVFLCVINLSYAQKIIFSFFWLNKKQSKTF